MTPDFSNTAVAFESLTTIELWRNYFLFRLVQYPRLVQFLHGLLSILFKLHFPVTWLIKRTVFAVFCGGESVHESKETIQRLAQEGVGTILDYAAEASSTEEEFDDTTRELLSTIHLAKDNPAIPFSVFKVTGIARFALLEKLHTGSPLSAAEQEEWNRAQARMKMICDTAAENRVRVLIDAEESWIQNPIDKFALEMMRAHNRKEAIVYNTVQMYRIDRTDFLKTCTEQAKCEEFYLGIKLVRGAYMEKERARCQQLGLPDVIHATKADTDRAYDNALEFAINRLDRIALCVGTHNEKSNRLAVRLMEEKGLIPKDPKIYFAQLLGMSDTLTFNLAHAGFLAAKYVPYGAVRTMMPYLFRRAKENSSVTGQTTRELELVRLELHRRRSGRAASLTR